MPIRSGPPDHEPGPNKGKLAPAATPANQPEESYEDILAELNAIPPAVQEAQDRLIEGPISELSGAIHKYRALVEAVGDFNYDRAGIVIDPKTLGLPEDKQVTAAQLIKALEGMPDRLSRRAYSFNRPDQAAKLQAIEDRTNKLFHLINGRLIGPLQKKAERQGKKIEHRYED